MMLFESDMNMSENGSQRSSCHRSFNSKKKTERKFIFSAIVKAKKHSKFTMKRKCQSLGRSMNISTVSEIYVLNKVPTYLAEKVSSSSTLDSAHSTTEANSEEGPHQNSSIVSEPPSRKQSMQDLASDLQNESEDNMVTENVAKPRNQNSLTSSEIPSRCQRAKSISPTPTVKSEQNTIADLIMENQNFSLTSGLLSSSQSVGKLIAALKIESERNANIVKGLRPDSPTLIELLGKKQSAESTLTSPQVVRKLKTDYDNVQRLQQTNTISSPGRKFCNGSTSNFWDNNITVVDYSHLEHTKTTTVSNVKKALRKRIGKVCLAIIRLVTCCCAPPREDNDMWL